MSTRHFSVLILWCAFWLGTAAAAASCRDLIPCDESNPCPATSSACPALVCSPLHVCVESYAPNCPDGSAPPPEDAAPAPPIFCEPDAGCDGIIDSGTGRD